MLLCARALGAGGWPAIDTSETPQFLFLRDGRVVARIAGYRSDSFVAEFRRHEAWRAIPVVVITARDLSREDHDRLNGYVEKILQKGAAGRDQLLAEVREHVAASVARRRPRA